MSRTPCRMAGRTSATGSSRDPTVAVIFLGADDPHFTNFCRTSDRGRTSADPVGPTVQDLVSAWANLPGVDATAARDVTIDGFKGMQIEFTVPDYNEEDCNGLYNRCSFGGSERRTGRFGATAWCEGIPVAMGRTTRHFPISTRRFGSSTSTAPGS